MTDKSMKDMRATLVAYVEPPGVQWVNNVGASPLHNIYVNRPLSHRFAVVKRHARYEVLDFWEMTMSASGWLVPSPGAVYDDPDAAVVATVLLNQ